MNKCNRQIQGNADLDSRVGVGTTATVIGTRWPARGGFNRVGRPAALTLAVQLAIGSALGAISLTPGLVGDALAKPHSENYVAASHRQPSIAFHYGAQAPLDELRIFNIVVVEPGHDHDPARYKALSSGASRLFAYVSIGETGPTRPYAAKMPPTMFAGRNTTWNSRIVNQAHPDWPEFFVDQVIAPLWKQGYRGFFLDTMDSYQAIGGTPDEVRELQAGLVRAIARLKERFPKAELITNRGFELLERIAPFIRAVAAESLFGRYDHNRQRYLEVPKADREWILTRLRLVQAHGLQAIAIDYANPGDRNRTREIAVEIAELGITPFVTSGDLNSTGIGSTEVVPRRVLLLHNTTFDHNEQLSVGHRLGVMPLQYLGFRVDLLDVDRFDLPTGPLADRYAAVVGFFNANDPALADKLTAFLSRARAEQVPIALLDHLGFEADSPLGRRLGLTPAKKSLREPITISHRAAIGVGNEISPQPDVAGVAISAPAGSLSLLELTDARGQRFDGAAVTPWGGYVVAPFSYVNVPGNRQRWVVDPIHFLSEALLRGAFRPMPDVTTENGKRLLLVHIDGDGFASRAEIPEAPLAAEVMYRDFIKRYPVPHTVSVIEGETSQNGVYRSVAPTLEAIARDIFKLDNVEVASHSYSHPFQWRQLTAQAADGGDSRLDKPLRHLPVPGYNFGLKREILGSANYINATLAPAGKSTQVFLWTGDCQPPGAAVAASYSAGLLNMNGGDTLITYENRSIAHVAPLSIRKNGWLQVYAPNQNENVYTNNWTGPFYGFGRVIETFKLTESPRRLKPINIYYHTYSASKAASIAALHRVYRYALSQPVNPVYASEYVRKVHDFESFATGRDLPDGSGREVWRLVGNGNLRTVRVPNQYLGRVNWDKSTGIAGFKNGTNGSYLHMSGPRARVVIERRRQSKRPGVVAANGRIRDFRRTNQGFRFELSGHVTGQLTLAHAGKCSVHLEGRRLVARGESAISRPTARPAARPTGNRITNHEYRIHRNYIREPALVSVSC